MTSLIKTCTLKLLQNVDWLFCLAATPESLQRPVIVDGVRRHRRLHHREAQRRRGRQGQAAGGQNHDATVGVINNVDTYFFPLSEEVTYNYL